VCGWRACGDVVVVAGPGAVAVRGVVPFAGVLGDDGGGCGGGGDCDAFAGFDFAGVGLDGFDCGLVGFCVLAAENCRYRGR
jgi:hypothetical protein